MFCLNISLLKNAKFHKSQAADKIKIQDNAAKLIFKFRAECCCIIFGGVCVISTHRLFNFIIIDLLNLLSKIALLMSIYLVLPLPKSKSVKVLQTPSLLFFVDIINGRPLTQKFQFLQIQIYNVNFFTDR